ncbi:LysR family transcriptional regulator, partial [Pseudomonas syringae pv. maculicola]
HTFNRNHLTIDAARMGMGVAIARKALITDELEQGLLIVPFGHPIKARKKYVLAYREGALSTPARRAVHDWLVGEAAH